MEWTERRILAGNGRNYPNRFYNRGPDGASFNIPTNVNPNRLIEFPIIRNDAGQYVPLTEGADPGLDRLIFDGRTGHFAGIVTHRGEGGNRVHPAVGFNDDVNVPRIDNDFGATIIDADPFGWFFGVGSGPFPFKRSPTVPPASFPTTHDGCPSGSGQCYCYNAVTSDGFFPRDAGIRAIDQACSDWSGQQVPVSSADIKTLSTTKKIVWNRTQWYIELSIWQILLATVDGSTVDQASCVKALRSAMDDCQTDTISKKIGGEYMLDIPGVGSQLYIIHPANGNPAPT